MVRPSDSVVRATAPDRLRETTRGDTIVMFVKPLHATGGTLVPELSIGGPGEPADYFVRTVNDILAARDGTVWILDHGGNPTALPAYPTQVMGPPLLRHYDPSGKYLGTAGRVGKALGEFQFPSNLAQLPDGRIAVWEASLRRATLFSEDGVALASWTVEGGIRPGTPMTFTVGADGRFYVGWSPKWEPGADLSDSVSGPRFIRFSATGGIIDTIPAPDAIPNVGLRQPVLIQDLGGGRVIEHAVPLPYAPRSIVVWNPLGFWITGLSTHYGFELRRSPGAVVGSALNWHDGDTVISVRRDVPTVPVNRAERDEQATRLATTIRVQQHFFRLFGTLPATPEVKPAWTDIVAAPDGQILVQPSMSSEPYEPSLTEIQKKLTAVHWREPTAYDVFEPNGILLGRIVLPDGVQMVT